MPKFHCTRCGAEGTDFDAHVCAGMRKLSDLPTDLLEQLARKQISEKEAWEKARERWMQPMKDGNGYVGRKRGP